MVFKTLFLLPCALLALSKGQDDGNVFKPNPLTPGPWVDMSHGAIWPRPAEQSSQPNFYLLDPKSFKFEVRFYKKHIRKKNGTENFNFS